MISIHPRSCQDGSASRDDGRVCYAKKQAAKRTVRHRGEGQRKGDGALSGAVEDESWNVSHAELAIQQADRRG